MSADYSCLEEIQYYGFRQILPEGDRYLSSTLIHPLKQKSVLALVRAAQETPSVEYIAVFGSAITLYCRPESDVDYVVWDKEHKFKSPLDDVYDKFYADEISRGDAIFHDVNEYGVVVYAKNLL